MRRSIAYRATGSWLSRWGVTLLLLPWLAGCAGFSSTTTPLHGTLKVWGSTALDPLVVGVAQVFQARNPGVVIDTKAIGSKNGLKAVVGPNGLTAQDNVSVTSNGAKSDVIGTADIGTSDIYADPAQYPNPDLTDHIVAVVPFTMVLNPAINAGPTGSVTKLTRQQIIDIFSTGKIVNWRDVGGPDLAIAPIVRPASSGTRATFRKYVLGGRDERVKPTNTDDSKAIHDAVATTPGAISYLGKAYVDEKVKTIQIDGYDATAANIRAGNYAFWSFEHMYTLDDTRPLLRAFLDFMVGPEAQQIATQKNYLPIDSVLQARSGSPSAFVIIDHTVEVRQR